jgi:hypothetical protein
MWYNGEFGPQRARAGRPIIPYFWNFVNRQFAQKINPHRLATPMGIRWTEGSRPALPFCFVCSQINVGTQRKGIKKPATPIFSAHWKTLEKQFVSWVATNQ